MVSASSSPLLIYTASAGSGKTFRLTRQYLYLILSNAAKFNNLLAVTFTNKAAFEMKSRIISELYKIATNQKSDHLQFLSESLSTDAGVLMQRAQLVLKKILNNYSQFALGTIDSFFQTILKGFLRELKLPVGYDVALNSWEILEKSVNDLLETLKLDNIITGWLTEFAYDNISNDKSWNIKRDLLSLSKEIFNEKYQQCYPLSLQNDDIQVFLDFNKKLTSDIEAFEQELIKLASSAVNEIEKNNLNVKDFYYGNTGIANFFYTIKNGDIRLPGKRVLACYNDLSIWASKSTRHKDLIDALVHECLYEVLEQTLKKLDDGLVRYNTVRKIKDNIYVLAILSNINKSVLEYCNKNNIFLLAFAGSFLQTIVDNNETPFVYEKAGNWYYHFMIDEFQDTSLIQWNNFKVLLQNSLAEGKQNIVVGDIKQAIYKWRNSDWHILGNQVEKELGMFGVQKFNLDQNWRSYPAIVNFNNAFFNQAPDILDTYFLSQGFINNDSEAPLSFKKLFEEHVQKVTKGHDGKEGYVSFDILEGDENKEWKNQAQEKLLEQIKRLQDNQYSAKDIAILVRKKDEGKEIAEFLVSKQNEVDKKYNLRVMSADSLHVASASAVKVLVSFLQFLNNPTDDIVKSAFILNVSYHFKDVEFDSSLVEQEKRDNWLTNFIKTKFGEDIPVLQKYTLNDVVCIAITSLELNAADGQLRFIASFQDSVHDYVKRNGGNLQGFLDWWDENSKNLYLSMTEQEDAINIFTIHKSKGLEFKVVIMPYLEWEFEPPSSTANYMWCENLLEYQQFVPYIPVKYSNALAETEFKNIWLQEKYDIYCEHLNLLYVAFTRAMEALICFVPNSELFNSKYRASKIVTDTLQHQGEDISSGVEFGKLIEQLEKVNPKDESTLKLNFSPFNQKIRIAYNSDESLLDTSEIKNKLDEGKSTLELLDIRDRGKIMHKIFEKIRYTTDVDQALSQMVIDGVFTASEGEELQSIVNEKITFLEVVDWFSGKWTIQNEAEIILPDGQMKRPDRIMQFNDKTLVVDYKFGKIKRDKDRLQVEEYIQLLTSMGRTNVSGAVWYVNLESVEYV